MPQPQRLGQQGHSGWKDRYLPGCLDRISSLGLRCLVLQEYKLFSIEDKAFVDKSYYQLTRTTVCIMDVCWSSLNGKSAQLRLRRKPMKLMF